VPIDLLSSIPKKLKDDAIIEALCEFRFECDDVPERVVGRLSDHESWNSYTPERLPSSDIPPFVKAHDPNLKYQPVLQLRSEDGLFLVKIGSNVISFHNLGKYCGWDEFLPRLRDVCSLLFGKFTNLSVTRMGFRYFNALTPKRHMIKSVAGLNVTLQVADETLSNPINLNYGMKFADEHYCMTRIASPEFVQGKLPESSVVIIDIDVHTSDSFRSDNRDAILSWTEDAHAYEKQAFFRLIPLPVLKELIEDEK
jgi:uncharacterized protein (TIGR04255 family)